MLEVNPKGKKIRARSDIVEGPIILARTDEDGSADPSVAAKELGKRRGAGFRLWYITRKKEEEEKAKAEKEKKAKGKKEEKAKGEQPDKRDAKAEADADADAEARGVSSGLADSAFPGLDV